MKILVFIILLATTPAYAKICTKNNKSDCSALGYTSQNCPYGGVACPYNTHLWKCATWTCSDGRYYSAQQSNMDCIQVTYKGMTCYDCSIPTKR